MESYSNNALQQFRNLVGIRFQLYNSLFTSLPFHRIEKTGVLLSLFLLHCEEGYRKKQSPVEIVDSFLAQYTSYKKEQESLDLLFRFIQYTERQVVLFDALEDSAFKHVNDLNGTGTLKHLQSEILQTQTQDQLEEKLKDFSVRLVLTAHPTQFYPGEVLGIINDLSKALNEENAALINMYLQQLGKTPFLKKQKPSPYDEAVSLLWFMENVFYPASGKILMTLKNTYTDLLNAKNPIIRMGFWPGGDRDGNPFVTADITLKVAAALRRAIIRCYFIDVRHIKRRLTFKGVEEKIADLERLLYANLFVPDNSTNITQQQMLSILSGARVTLIEQHNGLFLHLLDDMISKVEIFGVYFASLDVRQDSAVHVKLFDAIADSGGILPADYKNLSEENRIKALENISLTADISSISNDLLKDTLQCTQTIKTIQQLNGEEGCNRYIISQCTSAANVMEVFALFTLTGWKTADISVDIVPLFETVDDLQHAASVMQTLYENKTYSKHLKKRGYTQTIMLGFSDGTKDGGYLMANWAIYKAKQELTGISKKYDIDVVFFDGRGGPPARGGGKTHKFYASMGKDISNKEIQLTVQGQTVSSNFGTIDSARFNIEQLIHAGITNAVFSTKEVTLNEGEEKLIQSLADDSYASYIELKEHPYFMEYLSHASPLKFYAETNIGSRPAKRGGSAKLSLKDLRAIPYVGAWSQLKQNVTGYYGVGTALQKLHKAGNWKQVQQLYKESLFFKTLIDNCEMAMKKCYFPLTEYLSHHPRYSEIWNMMYNEYELTVKYVLKLSGNTELMADYPIDQLSITMRERIVLPLATIQQYALSKVRDMEEQLINSPTKETFGKLAMRCSFGIINAGRNSA